MPDQQPVPPPGKAPAEEPFILAAILSLLGATTWMALRPPLLLGFFYSPEHLALTHLVTLGFLSSMIMGVLLRAGPALLSVAPRSRRLALLQAALFLLGASGMVTHFALGGWLGLATAAPLVLVAALVQAWNWRDVFVRAARGDVACLHVAAALLYLPLAASLGVAYGSLHAWGVGFGTAGTPVLARLGAHLLLAVGGWITTMVLGLQSRILPTTGARGGALLRFVLLQLGLLGGAACLLAGLPGLPVALAAIVLALALHLARPLVALRRQRAVLGEIAALVLLLLAALAALAESLDLPADSDLRLRALHATVYALLVGFGPLTIASTAARLFPPWVREELLLQPGRRTLPPLGAIGSPRLRDASVAALLLGVLATAAGIAMQHELLVECGTWIVVAGAALFAANFVRTASWALLRREWTPPR